MKVTGMMTEADKQTNEITIDDQESILPDRAGGGVGLVAGRCRGTLFCGEQGGQKIITRIGQAQ